jgi:chromosome segregation ATPase
MSENDEEEKEEHPQSSDFPMTGYEAAEEERRSLENEERNAHVTSLKEEPSPAPAKQQKRDEKRGKQRLSAATDISMAASAWQVTLFDLDKQLNRQRALMERMADDIKHLRKQFNQVQRDLAKFQKRMEKIRTTPLSTAKRGKRRG